MSLRENLSINLRALCREHGSVAAICREMGVNRQQFDRYLTMDALPNKATTERICRYFGIDEAELYRDPASATISPARPRAAGKAGNRLAEGPIAARIFSTPRPAIEPGFYQTFFSIPGTSRRAALLDHGDPRRGGSHDVPPADRACRNARNDLVAFQGRS